jgi:hypothetical protein
VYRSVDELLTVVTSKPDTQVGRETRDFLAALNGELERQAAVRRELRRAREMEGGSSGGTTIGDTVKAVHPEKKNEAEGNDDKEEEGSQRWRDKIAKKVEAKKD